MAALPLLQGVRILAERRRKPGVSVCEDGAHVQPSDSAGRALRELPQRRTARGAPMRSSADSPGGGCVRMQALRRGHYRSRCDSVAGGCGLAVRRQIVDAGRLLDVPCYDHVVLAGVRYVSFAEAGLL